MKMTGKLEAENSRLKEIHKDFQEQRMRKSKHKLQKFKDYISKLESSKMFMKFR